jgi:serine/threonine protein kinase
MGRLLDIAAGRVVTVATFYQVSELLGVGRYSEVYKAFDSNSHTDVALKLYAGFDPPAHEMAKAEEATLARIEKLNSEYFPRVRRSARHRIQNHNHPVLVLELASYIDTAGQKRLISLKDILPGHRETAPLALDSEFWVSDALLLWIVHLFQAVKQIHDLGVIHRDIKPANIMLKRGAGQSASVPLFLDFNCATTSDSRSSRGTPRYLPPEVVTGKRIVPSVSDDLWAVAMMAWEMLHGEGTSPETVSALHDNIVGLIPDGVIDALRKALLLSPESRYQNASDLLAAIEAAVRNAATERDELTTDEVALARTSMMRIRSAMWQALAPPGELVVPKEVEEAVTTVIAWLSQEDTQSLDLVSEIVRLGPLAIPVCLQQGYRLSRQKDTYREIVRAVVELASTNSTIAFRSIDKYALSSNLGVRALCWAVCEELQYFPELLLDSLKGDEGLLLPAERLKIADLCIRFSAKRSAVLALVKYMCREYILDRARYRDLRNTVARRMHELQLREEPTGGVATAQQSERVRRLITPLLIAQDTGECIWEELKEFDDIPDEEKEKTERGLIELMAEAFAATGAAALEIIRNGKVPRMAGSSNLPVFIRFASKLATSNADALTWLQSQAPLDREAKKALETITRDSETSKESPDGLLEQYLQSGANDRQLFNQLRFWRTDLVLQKVKSRLKHEPSPKELDHILKLLVGHDDRLRPAVVDVVLTHWTQLSQHDYPTAVRVLTQFDVPPRLKRRATEMLNKELAGPHASSARMGLEKLLR